MSCRFAVPWWQDRFDLNYGDNISRISTTKHVLKSISLMEAKVYLVKIFFRF